MLFYFHRWKEEICGFIEKHWNTLMPGKSKPPTWVGTIAGTLSVHSHNLFKSGQTTFNETGWWALQEVSIPKANPENYRISKTSKTDQEPLKAKFDINANTEYGRGKRQRKTRDLKKEEVVSAKIPKIEPQQKIKTIPLMIPTKTPTKCAFSTRNKKDANVNKSDRSKKSSNKKVKTNQIEPVTPTIEKKPAISETKTTNEEMPNSQEPTTPSMEEPPKPVQNAPYTNNCAIMAELSEAGYSGSVQYDDPFASLFDDMSVFEMSTVTVKEEPDCDKKDVPVTGKTNTQLTNHTATSTELGLEKNKSTLQVIPSQKTQFPIPGPLSSTISSLPAKLARIKPIEKPLLNNTIKPLNVKEENEFLAKINSHPLTVETDCSVRRLRRKLLNRKLKRDMGVPLFSISKKSTDTGKQKNTQHDLENENKNQNSSFKSEVEKNRQNLHHPALKDVNILDKFCNFLPYNNLNSMAGVKSKKRFIALIGIEEDIGGYRDSITSPYTSRVLKPYIRRDFATLPPKLKILRDIQKRCTPPIHRVWPIDYCYVQPTHVPAVNAMCSDFFWPGIDLTECLQYPEFSCVVLYRKLVIGFAFMVPDVKFNEAYISFILVHPDWRRSGIATNMIYHLVQTCMGKDITLHVSPSNPSMLLYQKFGFKAEALILDFYKKYIPEEDRNSKHAFLLRLQR